MEHIHPIMAEALRGHWPQIAPGTPPDEAKRVADDLEYQQHRESMRYQRAMDEQIRYQAVHGVL